MIHIQAHFIGTAWHSQFGCFKLSQGKQYPPENLEALLCPFDPQCLGFAKPLRFVVKKGGCADQTYVIIIIIYIYVSGWWFGT
jgi:hypothetical protein